MFSLTPCFKGIKHDQNQVRVLRSTRDYFLVGTAEEKDRTTIRLIRPRDSSSMIVVSLSMSIDIVNASFSANEDIIHITEKVLTKGGELLFRAHLLDIARGSRSKDIFSKEPIDGFFINYNSNATTMNNTNAHFPNSHNKLYGNNNNPKNNYFVLYIANSIILYRVQSTRKSIEMAKIKALNNVIWYNLNNESNILTYISESRSSFLLGEIGVDPNGFSTPTSSFKIVLNPHSLLPDDFALRPINLTRLPIFNVTSYRIFITKKEHSHYYIIEQIYDLKTPFCTFQITVYPTGYSQRLSVPNVAADIPICFFQIETLLFVYAPNNFVCIIDISREVPFVTFMPKQFASTVCGECVSPLVDHDAIIDLDSAEIFKLALSFQYPQFFINTLTKEALFGLATICARLSNIEYMSSIFRVLELKNDHTIAINFFKDFFNICQTKKNSRPTRSNSFAAGNDHSNESKFAESVKHILKRLPHFVLSALSDFDKNYPSASARMSINHHDRKTRTGWFCQQIKETKMNDENYQNLLSYMKQQNNMVMNIRAAIDQWTVKYDPPPIWKMIIGFSIQNETIFCDFPAVPYLKTEMEKLSQKFCSPQMTEIFAKNGLFRNNIRFKKFDQVDYWNKRFCGGGDSKSDGCSWKVCTRNTRRTKSDSEKDPCSLDSIYEG